ncbi:MAG: 3-methyl-2-oxobutanoate hydroxymethyltransferase, partial [Verrucomicrobia bacterium]|nr:3-methyl-2-oxobutanoate hydroxymethyltransferase [Verrucomicrobiota bacterium]
MKKTQMKWTVDRIRALKGGGPFACITAVDAATGRWADETGIPLVLVGDSLAMTVLGYETTLPVTVDQMLHHTAAVVRGNRRALVVADMPFLSYQASPRVAVANAGRFLKEAGADAVKIEGGAFRAETVRALVRNGIPVMGHIGLLPQNVRAMGGYKVQGRRPKEAALLLEDARALERAGAFAVVLEGMPPAVARRITRGTGVPTVGIGAGPDCDGQILVLHDLLGLGTGPVPKFVKPYAGLGVAACRALSAFRRDVESGRFP